MDESQNVNRLSSAREWALLLFLAVLIFLLYINTIKGEFLFDDLRLIPNNPQIRLSELTFAKIAAVASTTRPVAMVSFALNYYFHQYEVAGYHIINILVHIATSCFLYFFLKTTLNLPLVTRCASSPYLPFVVVLLWAVNPVHTQSVSYIVQRMNSMSAMFYILAFLCYVQGRLQRQTLKRSLLFTGTALSMFLALGSKEIAATLPFFILLYEWFFFQRKNRLWLGKAFVVFFCLIAIVVIVLYKYPQFLQTGLLTAGYEPYPFSMAQRLLTELRVVVLYMTLLVFPHPSRLNLDYDFPISFSLFTPPSTAISLAFILLLIVLAVFLVKKEPLMSFCIWWFLGNLVIESTFIPLDLVFEQRTYLPSIMMVLLLVMIWFRFVRIRMRYQLIVLSCLMTFFSAWTVQRNTAWSSPLSMMLDSAYKSPGNPRPAYNVACEYAKKGRVDEALVWLQKVVDSKSFNRWDLIKYDSDLNAIRSTPQFENFYQQVVADRDRQNVN